MTQFKKKILANMFQEIWMSDQWLADFEDGIDNSASLHTDG